MKFQLIPDPSKSLAEALVKTVEGFSKSKEYQEIVGAKDLPGIVFSAFARFFLGLLKKREAGRLEEEERRWLESAFGALDELVQEQHAGLINTLQAEVFETFAEEDGLVSKRLSGRALEAYREWRHRYGRYLFRFG